MPNYDYVCPRCGPFTRMRPMAECELPHDCPGCQAKAPRAFLTAPYCTVMPSERRRAHATNERSASTPQRLSELKKAHGAGCSCCTGKPLRAGKRARNGAKSFPGSRPWMISH